MTKDVLIAALVSAGVSALLGPVVIPFLRRLKFGQQVREDGPQGHLKKQGTPTMGGIIFLLAIVVASLIFIGKYPKIVPVLFVTVGFGLVGFLDDYIKIVKKRSEGLNPKQKLIFQLLIAGIFGYYLMTSPEVGTAVIVPFFGVEWDLKWLYIPFVIAVMLGTDNGVNFTDGLDGLCSSVTVLIATFFTIVAMGEDAGIAPICAAVAGSLLGFLLFNLHPAKVFMGDTGSLALGGFVASAALMMRMPLFILIIGAIYVVEVLSVIIQVAYFKKTGGKRIFRMAPIHHHFELGGWSENRVVAVFSGITALLCLVGYLAL